MFQNRSLNSAFVIEAMRRLSCTPQNAKQKRPQLVSYSLPGVIGVAARFNSSLRADLATRGFAISFSTLARVASPSSFLVFFFILHR